VAHAGRKRIEEKNHETHERLSSYAAGCALHRRLCGASASAQDSAARDAAIGKCVRQAHLQYPNEEQQMQRADVYKACMVAAGFQP
jgi:hypothetical protein